MKKTIKILFAFVFILAFSNSFSINLKNKTEFDGNTNVVQTQNPSQGNLEFETLAIGGYNVYYGHLHNHSNVSDGTGTPDDAYNYAKNTAGLDFFGLSDHAGAINETEWATTKTVADNYNLDGFFTTFWGFEWSHNTLGHVTIINTDDYCTEESVPTFPGLLSWLNSRECAAFLNHPGRQNSTGTEFDHFANTPSDKIVGMELWNKGDNYNMYYYNDGYIANDGNLGFFDEAIVNDWKIGAGGSEDNHTGDWGTRTNYRMAVLAASLTRTDLFEAIKNKRFFSTLDKNLKMSFKINGGEMGSTILGSSGQNLEILVSDDDAEIFTKVELIKNGNVYITWTPNVSGVNISATLSTSDGDYYYIRVTQADNDKAISSPVFVEGGIINIPPVCVLTNPNDAEHFNITQTIILSANASDQDGTVSQVEFFVDGKSVGLDNTFPYSVNWTITKNGSYSITAKATDDLGVFTISTPVEITVGEFSRTVVSQISSGNDDVEESAAGVMYLSSTDIELVNDSYQSAGDQTVGLRFTGLGIPQGAFITNAFIQFTVDETVINTAMDLKIFGHNIDDSPSFSSLAFDVSGRNQTTTSVNWIPPTWTTENVSGVDQQTPDLSPIIQEIVNLPAFSQSSAISLIITGTGTRTAWSYEGMSGSAAVLHVEYSNIQNDPPAFVSNPISKLSATEDAAYSSTLAGSATDPDGDELTFSKTNGPGWLMISPDGTISGTPKNDNVGINSWTVQASDGKGGTDLASLQITVANVNDAPSFSSETINLSDALIDVGYSGSITDEAMDIDFGDVLSFYLVSGPGWLTISPEGVLSGTSGIDNIGKNLWTIEVRDGKGGTDQATLEITVIDPSNVTYCASHGNATDEWISKIDIGGQVNSSGSSNATGYEDFTKKTAFSLVSGSTNSLTLQPDFSSRSKSEYWSVWIDYNLNGNFNDPGEMVFTATRMKSSVSGTITIPVMSSIETTMRVSMSRSGTPSSCEIFLLGEVEDYSVVIIGTDPQPTITDFSANSTSIEKGGSVQFTDLSTNNPTTLLWSFPGGTPSSSTEQNPSVTYGSVGFFNVTLTASYSEGSDQQELKVNYITVTAPSTDPPTADFSADTTTVFVGDPVQFTDLSTNVTNWNWDFGDTQTSTAQNPLAVYNTAGTYSVSLTVSNTAGSDEEIKTNYIIVTAPSTDPPTADFSATPTSTFVGETIQFTDLSSPLPTSWLWDFGDGQTSSLQNPSKSYSSAGTYTVTLTATNNNVSDVMLKTDYISISELPVFLYCEPTNIDNSADYIDFISIGGTANSIKSTNGFTLFTSPDFKFVAGETYQVTLSPYDSKNRNFWRIWIDANGDGDYEDANETLFSGNNKRGEVSGTITIPSDISVANTRLRISMKTGSSPGVCEDNFAGEVEDYNVNITQPNYKSATITTSSENVETSNETLLKIYPNPFNNEINISIDGSDNYEKAFVQIHDISGRLMYSGEYGNQRKITINHLQLNPGTYFIKVQTGDFVKIQQLIKTQ